MQMVDNQNAGRYTEIIPKLERPFSLMSLLLIAFNIAHE